MSRIKSLLNYFKSGFDLANKSIEIYFLGLALSLIISFESFFLNTQLVGIIQLLTLVGIIINLAFSLSIPIFLLQKQQGHSLNFQNILSITIQNTKRIILPVILLSILIFVLFIASLILVAIYLHPTKEVTNQFFQSLNGESNTITYILIAFFSFFVYVSFLFSLEHKGFITSIIQSIILSFKNLSYLLLVLSAGIISYALISFLPIDNFWGLFSRVAIASYTGFVITSTTLFYYQKLSH